MNRRIKYLEDLAANGGYTTTITIFKKDNELCIINYSTLKHLFADRTDIFTWLEYRCLDEEFMKVLSKGLEDFYGNVVLQFKDFQEYFNKNAEVICRAFN